MTWLHLYSLDKNVWCLQRKRTTRAEFLPRYKGRTVLHLYMQLLMGSELTTFWRIKVRTSWHVTQCNFFTFKAYRFLYVPPGSTFRNSTWYSLCVRCFVRISEQTAAFAVYSINWLVFIALVESVYSAVRTDSLYKADYVWSLNNRGGKCLQRGADWFLI